MLLKVNALFICQMYTIQLQSYAIVVLQNRVTTAFFSNCYRAVSHAFDSTRIQSNSLPTQFGGHPLSASVKLSEKLPPDTCAHQVVRGVNFLENFAHVLNG